VLAGPVGWKKETFRGSDVLRAQREVASVRTLRGLKSNDRGIPRAGMTIKDARGLEIGIVTSGTFSPSLKVGIALALIEPNFDIGDGVTIDVRGRESSATITALPFVPSHVR
jgi:aminomethyltransferase